MRAGGRQSNAQYQYTLQSRQSARCSTAGRRSWSHALEHNPVLTDVNSDQQQKGLETDLVIDRDTAARLGITPAQIDNTLYDAFGQRQVSTIYSAHQPISRRHGDRPALHAVSRVAATTSMSPPSGGDAAGHRDDQRAGRHRGDRDRHPPRNAPRRRRPASGRRRRRHRTSNCGAQCRHQCARQYRPAAPPRPAPPSARPSETMVPLSAVSHYQPGNTPLSVNHQGLFVASTISFNLQPGQSLGEAAAEINAGDRAASTCRPRSAARSPAPRSCSSNRCPTSRS